MGARQWPFSVKGARAWKKLKSRGGCTTSQSEDGITCQQGIYSLMAFVAKMIRSDYYLGLGQGNNSGSVDAAIVFQVLVDKDGDRVLEKVVPYVGGYVRTHWFEGSGANAMKKSECMLDEEWKIHGRYEEWYGNGQRKMLVSYHHGNPCGPFAFWSPAGVKVAEYEMTSVADMGCGVYRRWDEEGRRTLKVVYEHSKPVYGGYAWSKDGRRRHISAREVERIVGIVSED